MSATNDGGSAFPMQAHDDALKGRTYFTQQGMSLRDWFAGQALAGMCANQKLLTTNGEFHENNMKACYVLADAMLKARERLARKKGEAK